VYRTPLAGDEVACARFPPPHGLLQDTFRATPITAGGDYSIAESIQALHVVFGQPKSKLTGFPKTCRAGVLEGTKLPGAHRPGRRELHTRRPAALDTPLLAHSTALEHDCQLRLLYPFDTKWRIALLLLPTMILLATILDVGVVRDEGLLRTLQARVATTFRLHPC
jgi:hypothetical protein